MVITLNSGYMPFIPGLDVNGSLPLVVAMWFFQALGYLTIAWFEERRLSKKFGEIYQEYKKKNSFTFPVQKHH